MRDSDNDTSMSNKERVAAALVLLRQARDLLVAAGARRTVLRVRATIKSCEGAYRHARLEPYRHARQEGVQL